LQIILPCENSYLRAAASQKDDYQVNEWEKLPRDVEFELARLLEK
jgi:hypothetical protein